MKGAADRNCEFSDLSNWNVTPALGGYIFPCFPLAGRVETGTCNSILIRQLPRKLSRHLGTVQAAVEQQTQTQLNGIRESCPLWHLSLPPRLWRNVCHLFLPVVVVVVVVMLQLRRQLGQS